MTRGKFIWGDERDNTIPDGLFVFEHEWREGEKRSISLLSDQITRVSQESIAQRVKYKRESSILPKICPCVTFGFLRPQEK